jgi:hypothetical protein
VGDDEMDDAMVDDGEWASVGAVMMAWLTLSHYSTYVTTF